MKERPILFSAPMVRAILRDAKTQTRRIFKTPSKQMPFKDEPDAVHQDGGGNWIAWYGPYRSGLAEFTKKAYPNGEGFPCKYGRVGDRLWVRETWQTHCDQDHIKPSDLPVDTPIQYTASYDGWVSKKRPSIFMPRWASRITLEIKAVRVERLQDINHLGAIAEGAWPEYFTYGDGKAERKFAELWNTINGKTYPWEANPFVWVLEFRRIV